MTGSTMARPPVLLECTLRDGSYAVNFKFTTADTAIVVAQLARLGFKWIEIGHGQGLGAFRQPDKMMPGPDAEYIEAARAVAGEALIGMFFIPGLGRSEDLIQARERGLDFVRIGAEPDRIGEALPFIQEAKRLGFRVAMNFMKSYSVPPKAFGVKAARAAGAGAEIIYLVDSAGGMLPDDVARYLDEARGRLPDIDFGFHGHDNLRLAAANCLAALAHGARFIDCTLLGLGRDAGNPPTEVMVALVEKIGAPPALDFFEVLDTAEQYLVPLASNIDMYNMLSVAMGYGNFHSSFLPQAIKAAKETRADLKRLVFDLGRHDQVALDQEVLREKAEALAGTERPFTSSALLSGRLANEDGAWDECLAEMEIAAAKRHDAAILILLTPAEEETGDLLTAGLIAAEPRMVLGRITYGSKSALEKAVRQLPETVAAILLDKPAPQTKAWASEARRWLAAATRKEIITLDAARLENNYLLAALEMMDGQVDGPILVISRNQGFNDLPARAGGLNSLTIVPGLVGFQGKAESKYSACLCLEPGRTEDFDALFKFLRPDGCVYLPKPLADSKITAKYKRLIPLDMGAAYLGLRDRLAALGVALAGGSLSRQRDFRIA